MTALHKLRGVPVFAHPPLPPQFVAAQAQGAKDAGGTDIVSKIATLIEPNNRPAVKMQLEGALTSQRDPLAGRLFARASEDAGGRGLSARSHTTDLAAAQFEAPGTDRRAKCQLARQRMADLAQELGFNLELQHQLGEEMRSLDGQIGDLRVARGQLVARARSLGPAHDRSPKSAELARLAGEIREIDRKLRDLEARRSNVANWLGQAKAAEDALRRGRDRATYDATRYCEDYT
jgi:hypothetical protein